MSSKPSNREFRAIFDRAASRYDSALNPYALSRRIEFIRTHASGACLEVGAGTGEISRALQATCDATATDISPRMVEEIRKKINVRAVVCDAEELPFGNQSFDTVICGEAIYYLDLPERFIAEAHRVLKPNGLLLLTAATPVAIFYDRIRALLRAFGFGRMYFDDRMHYFPSARRIRALISRGGFSVENEYRFIIVPVGALDALNRILEKTLLRYAAAFIAYSARKI